MTRRAPSAATADDVLRYVAGYLEAHDGISPSYQNICDELGIHSKSTVDRKIKTLRDDGRLSELHGRKRSLRVLQPIALPRTPAGESLYFVRLP